MNNTLTILLLAQKKLNLRDIDGLVVNTYMVSIFSAIIILVLAILVASMIQYQSGANPKDKMKRKLWFWIFAVLSPISVFTYNFIFVLPNIKAGPAMNKFSLHNGISPIVAFVIYLVFGIVISKIFKRKKIGNWFNKSK